MSDFDEDDDYLPHIHVQPQKESKPFIVHWAGGVRIVKGRMVTTFGAGFPCCCLGDKARRIAAEGRQSWERERVTCKQCLKQIERHDFSARMHPKETA